MTVSKKFSGVSYYGGQNGSGHYQKLINLIPKADIHVEAFLGHSGVFNNMTMSPAVQYFGFDLDSEVISFWKSQKELCQLGHFVQCDYTAVALVMSMSAGKKVFIHFDPPYRNCKAEKKYLYDIENDEQYGRFLRFVLAMRDHGALVMVSHWKDSLFDKWLIDHSHGWLCQDVTPFRFVGFRTQSRKGPIDNGVYMSYDISMLELADKSFAGSNFTERQRIRRKVDRNVSKILSMQDLERSLLVSELVRKGIV